MNYFNLDLMEQDAKRRLKKHIDECVKTELADMAKKFEPKPIETDWGIGVAEQNRLNYYNAQARAMNGFAGYWRTSGAGGFGGLNAGFFGLGCL
jgi:hypothetical protein